MHLSNPLSLDTPRGRFSYRESGDLWGAPVVMIHGWPESSYCWELVAERLKTGLRVLAPDLRGLGDSERTPGTGHYLKHELARDVLALVNELGIEQFQLVGHDWGGVVAQEIAIAEPDRVQRLVIMNIAVINNLKGNQEVIDKVRSGSGRAYWYQHFLQTPDLPEAMIPDNEEAWLGHFLRTSDGSDFPREALDEYIRTFEIPGTAGTQANYYRTFNDDAKRWAGLSRHVFPMPALYLYGNRDHVIIPEYLNHIEDCFRSVRVEQVEAGHFLQEEQPGPVAERLNGFLQAQSNNVGTT
ncbi:MAG: alpha/beta hydrolase [Marinobacter sp.]|uniref:alpha/beta fold hydrolase n=1 Tax=Marinobacter sp. TaxID=50741 RepID=UPI00299EF655|nr:alpha/beta hydrolase [Marinobacter sp.]MDX1635935.1 alpha/beta hydrolase [Marinobacter sp.]